MSRRDLSGQAFGLLTVIRHILKPPSAPRWAYYVVCRCTCGRTIEALRLNVVAARTTSCGCIRKSGTYMAALRRANLRHGQHATPGYRAWRGAKTRCFNRKDRKYPDYGGRGITVCAAWRDSFEAFFRDMGPRPSPLHSLDRIDSDGHYEPGNCRWATLDVQNNNRRNVRRVLVNGERLALADAARRLGVEYAALKSRLRRSSVVTLNGITVETAGTTGGR